jgi:hypothetical protein
MFAWAMPSVSEFDRRSKGWGGCEKKIQREVKKKLHENRFLINHKKRRRPEDLLLFNVYT